MATEPVTALLPGRILLYIRYLAKILNRSIGSTLGIMIMRGIAAPPQPDVEVIKRAMEIAKEAEQAHGNEQ